MTTLTKLTPQDTANRIKMGEAVLVDVREPDEYAREHIPGAISLPISALNTAHLKIEADQQAIFHCKSGMRTDSNCAALSQKIDGEAYMLDGGLDAWRALGLPVAKDAKAPIAINRQVQMTAGGLVLLGVLLGWFVAPAWFGLSAFIGAGLFFAGASGWCGMATLLQTMPWNRRQPV
jgi:rhodanese-related sulfurtransferase